MLGLMEQTLEIKNQKEAKKNACGFEPARVDVWLCETNSLQSFRQAISFLTEHEQKRAIAIRNPDSQRAYISAHLLLQGVLTKHYGICPSEQVFACNAYGKPWLARYRYIQFNLSHTQGMVAVAVSNYPVGIDVEHTLLKNPIAMAQAFFAPVEFQQLVASHCPERLFRRYWVAKEASLKAMGIGIGVLLNQNAITPQALVGDSWQRCELAGRHMALCLPGVCGQGHDIAVAIELKQRMVEVPIFHNHQLRGDELLEWATDGGRAIPCMEKSAVLAA